MKLYYDDEKLRALNVRESPDQGSPVVRSIESGSAESVTRIVRGWCEVDGGWCKADFVTVEDGHEAESADVQSEADAEERAQEDGRLRAMTVAELKELAAARGVETKAKMNKEELIAAISGE